MDRRRILVRLTVSLILGGLVVAAIPFVSSLSPTEVTKDAAKVKIKISDIPDSGVLVVDLYDYKAMILYNPKLQVFLMPYHNGTYRLPDGTWKRPFVPCNNFIINQDGFSCEDPSLGESWNQEATWTLTGKSKGTWMPDLQTINFCDEGSYIVLSPECK